MQPGVPITEHRFASGEWRGTHLTLYPGRLLHDGGSVVEHMPLAHVAAVRIEFSRDGQRLKWAVIFFVVTLLLAVLASPLQAVAQKASDEVAEQAKRDGGNGTTAALQQVFRGIERGAGMLPSIAWVAGLIALAQLALYGWGRTILTLVVGGVEREYLVRGRDRALMEFAESLSGRLAELSG